MIKESNMVGNMAVDDVVIDQEVYPRHEFSIHTVDTYAEAMSSGDRFPPIVLEHGTNRLLDGMHRYQAFLKIGSTHLEVVYHEVPQGVPVKLYAASLSTKHGDRIKKEELVDVARETICANPDFSMKVVAQMLGVTRQTVGRWVGDITERRREVRKVRALLLSRLGWSTREIAEYLSYGQSTVIEDVNGNISDHLTEDLLREALEAFEDENGEIAEIAEQLREQQIFASWNEGERELLAQLRDGATVVVNMRNDGHPNLVEWATDAGLFIRIDRRSEWGNPFETPADGDRDTVIYNYQHYYLPHKPSLLNRFMELRGKALGCWCAPAHCHGDVLKAEAEK